MTAYNEFLLPDEVIKIVSNLTVDDEAFIVGGQATFLWAGFYEAVQPELDKYKPFYKQGHRLLRRRSGCRETGGSDRWNCQDA